MKIALTADFHLGQRQYRTDENKHNKYEWSINKALSDTSKVIKNEDVDLLIIAGDIFHKPDPTALPCNIYYRFLNGLGDIKVMVIPGNHEYDFTHRKSNCSTLSIFEHTYYADYEIKTVVIDDVLFVMMPYIYDTEEHIKEYLRQVEQIAEQSDIKKKVLVTHGITEAYSNDSMIQDPIMLSDYLVGLFNLVVIGHIHTPFEYKQGDTLVVSPGALVDYQAYEDRTGPVFVDTDTWEYHRVLVKSPHIIKKTCTEKDINEVLANVTEDIYNIIYTGDPDQIDHDLFMQAKEKTINLTIEVTKTIQEIEEVKEKPSILLDFYTWEAQRHPEYKEKFETAKQALIN